MLRKALLTLLAILLSACATPDLKKGPPNTGKASSLGDEGARPVLRGSDDQALVWLVAFEDFQCVYCAQANETIEKLRQEYGARLQIVFMNNPLPFHDLALPAAVLAMAADAQGKFWQVHDLLFAQGGTLSPGALEKIAREAEIDMAQLEADLKKGDLPSFIERSQRIAHDLGIRGTPSFFINGISLRGAQPIEKFREIIDAELKVAKSASTRGRTFIRARQEIHNAKLNGYLLEGREPPEIPKPAEAKEPTVPTTVYHVPLQPSDAQLGRDTAEVTLMVFSEFQCSFCARLNPTLKKLREHYGASLRLVFKHNPLEFHQHAMGAARASLCAKVQGKFWEMHDRLFAHQDALGDEALVGHAVAVGLDPAKFKTCLKSDKHDAQIATDVATALSVGARGTPNSFVNGRQLDGARPFDLFKELIDEELEKAQALLREGVKPENLYREIIAKGRSLPQLGEAQASFSDAGSPTLGDWENAPMKVTVFSDFQCPYCARVAPMMEEVQRRLGWKVAIKFRHFPLSVHQEARPAARASQCAHKQGRFWDFHDELFGHQELLGAELFEQTARKLKLDMKAFEACLTEAGTNAVVDRDMEEARKAGLKGTPNIYVNGREVEFAQMDAAAFERLSEKYFKDAIARVRSRSAKNACHKWLRCLGDLAKVGKKNARKLTAVANTLRAAAEQGNKGVLAACRAGLSVAIQSFPGPAPESCE